MTRDYREEHPSVGSSDSSSTTATQVKPGEYINTLFKDRYFIEKELGRGGIGVVYLARDRQLHSKPIVIKVLLEESCQDDWFKKKFRQEVEALARIDHPGIVGVLDSGATPDGKPFLAMQFIKGKDLRSMISNEGLDFQFVAQVIRQMGQALSAAHEEGVLHCDLKPENIMLQDLGEGDYQVKIVDFGIAKVQDSKVSASQGGTKVAGTLPYMAPEQIQGRPSAASDIFALGVIAYEMLTGRLPFNPPSMYQVMATLEAGVRIKPQDLRPNLAIEAQEIILKALSFNARDRYSRARDFGELLAQALTTDLEAPSSERASESTDIEMAHVLFMDIVSYSKLPSDQQTKIYKQLQQVVTGTEAFQKAKAARQIISRSTGDGMALVFFSGPKAAAECAMEISRSLRSLPEIKLRMGINSGPVYRVKDMNETVDVAGAGINMAQRVMDSGDAGHILLSKSTADVLREMGEWRDHIHELGEHIVKHGVSIHLYNLYVNEIGNSITPEKLRKKRTSGMAIVAGVVLLIAAVALGIYFISRQPMESATSTTSATGAMPPPPVEAERSLIYSLTVQKFQGNKMDGAAFQLADSNIIFNPKYQIKLNVATPQPGYIYVLNEAATGSREAPVYIMLYPSDTDKQKGATTRVVIPEPEDEWIEFDNNLGTEKLWLVWSESPVSELEAVKDLANRQRGEVRDEAQAKAIQAVLMKHSSANPHKEVDSEAKQTTVKAQGSVIAYSLSLEHQP